MTVEFNGREFSTGDIVRHFKKETVERGQNIFLYKIICFATHSETKERMVVYRALYRPYKVCVRPLEMFFSEVDKEKYPNIKQKYRFEKIEG